MPSKEHRPQSRPPMPLIGGPREEGTKMVMSRYPFGLPSPRVSPTLHTFWDRDPNPAIRCSSSMGVYTHPPSWWMLAVEYSLWLDFWRDKRGKVQ